MALRFPNPASLYSTFEATALGKALRESGLTAQMPSIAELIERGKKELADQQPELLPLVDALLAIRGELVIALLDVDPSRLERGDEFPLTAAAFVELGDSAGSFAETLRTLASAPDFAKDVTSRGEDLWLVQDSSFRLEVMVREGCLCVLVGPPAEYAPILDDLALLGREDSFLSNAVLTSTPMPLGGTANIFAEMYLSLGSLPAILDGYAPEAREAMSAIGFDKLAGFGVRTAVDGDLVSDSYALVSPGRSDPLTMLFESSGVDAKFARYTLPDADDASVFHFDLSRAVSKLKSDLPEGPREAFTMGIAQADRELGMSLERDVIGLFGAQLAFSLKGSFALLAKDPDAVCEMVLAVELRDRERFSKWVEQSIRDGMLPVSPRQLGSQKAYVVGLPMPGAPDWLEICFAWTDDAVVVASTFDALQETIEGAASGQIPSRMESTLRNAPADAYGVSVSSAAAEVRGFFALVRAGLEEASAKSGTSNDFPLPTDEALEPVLSKLGDSVRFWRASKAGLEVDQRSPIGNPLLLAMPFSIAAAVAIPNLLAARTNANERAAVATLRSMCSAQAQFQSAGLVDTDGDGLGEYGTLAELMGTVDLPGGMKASPPMLSSSGTFVEGRLDTVGYYFRAFLPGGNGQPIREKSGGGRDGAVDPQNAEFAFAIYAWPKAYGNTGFNAYMIDAEGEVLQATPNGRPTPYQGLEAEPEGDSAYIAKNTMLERDSTPTGVRGGPRGVVWVPVPVR